MVHRYLSLLSSHLSGMTVEARQGEIVTSHLDIEKVSPIVLESSREISRLATDRRNVFECQTTNDLPRRG